MDRETDYEKMFTVRMSMKQFEELDQFVLDNSINRSAFVRDAIKKAMESFKK